MQTLNDYPVTVSGLLLTLALAVLAVAAYYLRLTPEEVALWAAVLAALSALLSWWLKNRTTPTAKPVDSDGVPLIRADDFQAPARAEAAGRFVVKTQARGAASGSVPTLPAWNK
jgi:hypothetical protein